MRLMGIDYGKRKVGVAVATSVIPLPLEVIKYTDVDQLMGKLKKIALKEEVEKVVLGISEGKMAAEIFEFGARVQEELKLPVIFQDETLSTVDAKNKTIEAGMNRDKRRKMEDAFSAAIILQSYIEKAE